MGSVLYFLQYEEFRALFSVDGVRTVVEAAGIFGPVVFIILYIAVVGVFFPATPMTLAGGLLFGPWWGTLYVVTSATLGGILAFLFGRFMGRDFVEKWAGTHMPKIHRYDHILEEKGLLVIIFLRLIPFMPFNGLNLAASLTKIRLRDFALGTLLGIIPGVFTRLWFIEAVVDLSAVDVAISLGLTVLIIVAVVIISKYHLT